MRSVAFTMKKRGLAYVILLSVLVVFIGAAGLYAFEKDVNPGFKSFSGALWWTAMLIMSMGTENWPISPEGRVLCFLIAIYGLAVFGYVTASIASFFIGRDIEKKPVETAPVSKQMAELKSELSLLREEIVRLRESK
jgi:voltage-gated potassium channel